MSRLDFAAGGLILAALLALLGVSLGGSQIDLDVSLSGTPAGGHFNAGPLGPIEFVFSRPVQEALLASKVKLNPDTPGKIDWNDPLHAEFVPDRPFQSGVQYSLTIQSGVLGKSGEKIKTGQAWDFDLRSPKVIYVSASPAGDELWVQSPLQGGTPVQLTHTNGKLYDFSPAPNGEKIIYAAVNNQKGINLWVIDRDGKNNHVILDCGPDFCTSGSWSPDSKKMAYNRQSAGLSPGDSLGAPRPWILDIKTGETKPIYSDSQVIGYGPVWSPDGLRIATYDGVKGQIQIHDLDQNADIFVPSRSGLSGSFSPDGQKLYFIDLVASGAGVQNRVYVADVNTGQELPVANLPDADSQAAYDVPELSPDGAWLAVGVQASADNPVRQIWLVPSNGDAPRQITDDPQVTNLFYSWDRLGDGLLIQRIALGGGNSSGEAAVWWVQEQQLQVIGDNASMASWLP